LEIERRENSRTKKWTERGGGGGERERERILRKRKTEQKTRRTNERKRAKSYDTEISNLICRYTKDTCEPNEKKMYRT